LLDGARDVRARRILAAHHLDDEIDRGIVEDVGGVGREEAPVALGDAILVEIADEDPADLERSRGALAEVARVVGEQAEDAAADGAAAEEANLNGASTAKTAAFDGGCRRRRGLCGGVCGDRHGARA
jgi:hypothetical protein